MAKGERFGNTVKDRLVGIRFNEIAQQSLFQFLRGSKPRCEPAKQFFVSVIYVAAMHEIIIVQQRPNVVETFPYSLQSRNFVSEE